MHEWAILAHDEKGQTILRRVHVLSEEEQKLSDLGLDPHPLLVERMDEQYRPENDPIMRRSLDYWVKQNRQGKRRSN